MKPESIRLANNGYVAEDYYGGVYVAKSLTELAAIAGEPPAVAGRLDYAAGHNADSLTEVRAAWVRGEKIAAIKLFRGCFSPTIGLRESKEILETFLR